MVLHGDGPPGVPGEPEAAFAELSRVLLEARPLPATLALVARLAAGLLDPPGEASVTLARSGRLLSVGATGDLAASLDQQQYAADSGPSVAAARTGGTVTVEDTAAEGGHREFARLARRRGVTAVLAVGLPTGGRTGGALTVYRTTAGGLGPVAVELARALAGYAAGAVTKGQPAGAPRDVRLTMQSRAVIEQAKGVLMARHHCSADEAFTWLATESQRTNRKLRDLAVDLVAAVQRAGAAGGRAPQD
ncbi:GAF and ANTAR domain-containing protein [Geodermatophilus sp. CPCC 206100]|uniref:GAF and ANTAR domain-containing protein n=1 Tax=Geodermatophilus sp. CPCC 206100 TaxID=3020054 RepID=UPI003B00ABCD